MTSRLDTGLWLEAQGGPDPRDLARRIQYWEGLERAFHAHAPRGMRWGALPTARPPNPHARCARWLPVRVLQREVEHLLGQWFGAALAELGVDLSASSLGRARSWLDARAQLPSLEDLRLPSQLLARLGSSDSAQALLFELFAAPQLGRGLERYPEELERAVGLLTPSEGPLRAWDAGCAAGESTWALAAALDAAGLHAKLLGTTPWPLELLMARRRGFPHDPLRTQALSRAIAAISQRIRVEFSRGDLTLEAPSGCFDLVCCHGLLGGSISTPEAFGSALENLGGSLAPGGLLSIQDDFRADVHEETSARVQTSLAWTELAPGLFRKPR